MCRIRTADLRGLTYTYPGAARPALEDLQLTLDSGLTLVAGSSGSGKSTLLRLLNGLVPQFHGGRLSGSACVLGLDPVRTPARVLARRVGFVFQDPELQAVYGGVEREVAFALENTGVAPARMRRLVEEALESAGATELAGRRLATLSGGERQRVALAAALALDPDLVVLDEPTSQLDPEGAAAVAAACLRLARSGRAVVVAEHRLERLLPEAREVVLLAGGRVRAQCPARELAGLLPSAPAIVELGRALGWEPLPLSVEEARALAPELCALGPRRPARPEAPAWELRGIAAGPGSEPVLEEVDLAGAAGAVTVLMGPNGGGKTTLLRVLAGLLRPRSGAVERRPGRIAYLPQNPTALLHRPTLRREVELTLERAGEPRSDAARLLRELGLEGLEERYPRDLSSGQRERAALAAVLAGRPALALLDEPTRGMDADARARLQALVRRLAEAGTSVVLATHDADLAAAVGDRVVLVERGRVRDLGDPERALSGDLPYATQVGRLYPGGPASVAAAVSLASRLDPS